MNWTTGFALSCAVATCACAAPPSDSVPAPKVGGTLAPAATITLIDGSNLEATLMGVEEGTLNVIEDGRKRSIPLRTIDRLVFVPRHDSAARESLKVPEGAVLEQLLEIVVRNEPCGARRHPPLSAFHVDGMMRGGYRLYGGKYRQMLSPSFLSELLDAADDPERRWLVIGPLAAMYRIGRADELRRLPGNERAPIAQRVVATAALYRAGEPVAVDLLAVLFETAAELDMKKALLWLLGRSKDARAVEIVVGCLSHPDEEMSKVAARAAGNQQAPEAVQPLARIIRQRWKAREDVTFSIGAMGQIKTRESARLLVELIGDVRETGPESHTLQQLVWAFGSVTGERFSGKTPADSARTALQWWYEKK